MKGLGFRVQGLGFGVKGLGFRVRGSGFGVKGSGFRVQGLGFGVKGLGFRMDNSRIWICGFVKVCAKVSARASILSWYQRLI